ncbi:MAG: cytochrome-c oxidase, cbb3-type subunit III [Rhodobacterales bacterium 17-64-5]|nr:MAG: cytochrome-c oxidase, cbb3-type subunit III [Rhodobacterales bacterium 17-64-5]
MCAKPIKDDPKDKVGTTGHSWDGIEELNNPLPLWWVWTFYLCIAFALGYSVLYPAWPLITGATPGLLHASTRADVEKDIKAFDALNAPIKAKLVAADLTAIEGDPSLKAYAMEAGKSIFANNCAPCHGAGAAGVQGKGYPNLLDNDWLFGGTIDAIHTTVTHGVRNTVDPDARNVGIYMPAWSDKAAGAMADMATAKLTDEQVGQVVNYVLQISGQKADEAKATAGAKIFTENCAACHGADGKGNRDMGAPNLTDAIWLYGGDEATLTATITGGRGGVMPSWGYAAPGSTARLTEDQIRAVAVYVHSLGGGE